MRMAAVQWGELPPDELQRLAHDRSVHVRWLLTALHTTPQAVLRVLAEDPHPDVAFHARARLGNSVTNNAATSASVTGWKSSSIRC
ncbi:hypothetical protein [Nonomuraea rubra]|uniref:hypothetical protein n=1 Tax=Nonomuraea rubra TaxID=46180 RepID=UPI003CD062EF